MVYKASFVFERNEIKFLTIKRVEYEHIFFKVHLKCIIYIVGYAILHTQTIYFLLSNNMDFIPNNS